MIFTDDVAEYKLIDNFEKDALYNFSIWKKRYIEELEISNVVEKTIDSYLDALETFLRFVQKYKKEIKLNEIGARVINRYLLEYQLELAEKKYKAKNISKELLENIKEQSKAKKLGKNDAHFKIYEQFENSILHRLTTLKMFLKFISENNIEQYDYTKAFDKVIKIKIKDKFTDYLTVDEMHQVHKFMDMWPDIYKSYRPKSSLRFAYRDSLLLLIFLLTGARSDEVVHIKLEDISEYIHNDGIFYIIKIIHGKGGKKRSVAIHQKHIKSHIDFMNNNLPNSSYYLSSTYSKANGYQNKRLHPNTIREFSNYILHLIGINKRGLHAYRRGYATKRILYDGIDLSVVAKEIGNTSSILEKHYLKHNAEESIKNITKEESR